MYKSKIAFYAYQSDLAIPYHFEHVVAFYVVKHLATKADREFIALADIDAFNAFWRENGESLDMDKETAFALACNCELMVGGGAAPLFRVGFV